MKIAVITGASSGMGREFAIQLSNEANFDEMWVIARRKEALEALREQVHCPIRPDCHGFIKSGQLPAVCGTCWIWFSQR